MRPLLMALLFCTCFATAAFCETVHLSAAASLTDAVRELTGSFRQKHPDIRVLPNLASSGALSKQIVQGAPADIFISANPKWMTYLIEQDRVRPGAVHPFAANTLVVVGKGPALTDLKQLRQVTSLALGSPRSVPAGQYAEQALAAAGVLEALRARLILAKDVRQALMYAERAEVDAALVYGSDAGLLKNAQILLKIPPELHEQIRYPLALTLAGEKNAAARSFAEYLKGAEARAILEKHGFSLP